MSYNTLRKVNKCWSCAFYSAERKIDKSIISGTGVRCDNNGFCSNSESEENGKDVSEYGYCPQYAMWKAIEHELEGNPNDRFLDVSDDKDDTAPMRVEESLADIRRERAAKKKNRDIDLVRRSQERLRLIEESKARRVEEEKQKKKRRIYVLGGLTISLILATFVFLMVLFSFLQAPSRQIADYLNQYPEKTYTEKVEANDYEADFTVTTYPFGDYFRAGMEYYFKDDSNGYDYAQAVVIFRYGEDDIYTVCDLVVRKGDLWGYIQYQFDLGNPPEISLHGFDIGNLDEGYTLPDTCYRHGFGLIQEFYRYLDSFFKKVNSTYSIWSVI